MASIKFFLFLKINIFTQVIGKIIEGIDIFSILHEGVYWNYVGFSEGKWMQTTKRHCIQMYRKQKKKGKKKKNDSIDLMKSELSTITYCTAKGRSLLNCWDNDEIWQVYVFKITWSHATERIEQYKFNAHINWCCMKSGLHNIRKDFEKSRTTFINSSNNSNNNSTTAWWVTALFICFMSGNEWRNLFNICNFLPYVLLLLLLLLLLILSLLWLLMHFVVMLRAMASTSYGKK